MVNLIKFNGVQMKKNSMKIALFVGMITCQTMIFAMEAPKAIVKLVNESEITVFVLGFELVEAGWTYNSYKTFTPIIEIPAGQTIEYQFPTESQKPRWLYYNDKNLVLTGYEKLNRPLATDSKYKELPKVLQPDHSVTFKIVPHQKINRKSAQYVLNYNAGHPKVSKLDWVLRGDPELSLEEQNFLSNRARVTKPALLKLIKDRIEPLQDENAKRQLLQKVDEWQNLPRISLCMSGGGLRAMQASLGFMQGLSDTGLIDTTTYCAALSGSTWFVTKWLEQGGNPADLVRVREILQRGMVEGLIDTASVDSRMLADLYLKGETTQMDSDFLAQHYAENKESPSAANVWGMYLARMLFPDRADKYAFTLSSLADNANAALMPLPICTAISTRPNAQNASEVIANRWLEFTPYTVGVVEGEGTFSSPGHIPTWGFGRKYAKTLMARDVYSIKQPANLFLNRSVVELLPKEEFYTIERSCAQLLGTFGSAMTVRVGELERQGSDQIEFVKSSISKIQAVGTFITELTGWERGRQVAGLAGGARGALSAAGPATILSGLNVNNFYDPAAPDFQLRDGGIAFNLPLPPLLNPKRNVNIMIIMDASGDLHQKGRIGNSLREFRLYALRQKLKIPKELQDEKELDIRLLDLNKELEQKKIQVAVFGAKEDPNVMTIIYVPTILNKNLAGFADLNPTEKFSTFQFKYTQAESDQLIDYSRALANQVAPYLKQIIEQKAYVLNQKQ